MHTQIFISCIDRDLQLRCFSDQVPDRNQVDDKLRQNRNKIRIAGKIYMNI